MAPFCVPLVRKIPNISAIPGKGAIMPLLKTKEQQSLSRRGLVCLKAWTSIDRANDVLQWYGTVECCFSFLDETGGIVVDIGSSSIKLGYGGEDVPKAVYPSVLPLLRSLSWDSRTDSTAKTRQHIISERRI